MNDGIIERRRAQHRAHYYANKERYLGNTHAYYALHKERLKAYQRARYARLKTEIKAKTKAYRLRHKVQAFEAYGGVFCTCCGEPHIEFLTIDHINGGGSAHRRSLRMETGGEAFYLWLKRQAYPLGYRVLCLNCNFALGHFKMCPHEIAPKTLARILQ